jgi:hypothetical protein
MATMATGSISSVSITETLRGKAATDRLCVDRQPDEALTRGPDPLHLTRPPSATPKADHSLPRS